MIWVLLIALATAHGVAIDSAEYSDRDSCMAAGRNFEAAGGNDGWRVAWSCSPKRAS